jgi:hypothetical protein
MPHLHLHIQQCLNRRQSVKQVTATLWLKFHHIHIKLLLEFFDS